MNRVKQIVIAVSAAFAVGTIFGVQASPVSSPAGGEEIYVLAKGGTDSARDKRERKLFEDVQQIAKGGVKQTGNDGPTDKRKGHAFEDMQQIAKGGTDSARDKRERKLIDGMELIAKGGRDSRRDKAERNLV